MSSYWLLAMLMLASGIYLVFKFQRFWSGASGEWFRILQPVFKHTGGFTVEAMSEIQLFLKFFNERKGHAISYVEIHNGSSVDFWHVKSHKLKFTSSQERRFPKDVKVKNTVTGCYEEVELVISITMLNDEQSNPITLTIQRLQSGMLLFTAMLSSNTNSFKRGLRLGQVLELAAN